MSYDIFIFYKIFIRPNKNDRDYSPDDLPINTGCRVHNHICHIFSIY